jgi:sirohydrochlorin cobaltochelatase
MQIPQGLAPLRARHPHMALRYAWPFELDRIAQMLAEHLRSFLR